MSKASPVLVGAGALPELVMRDAVCPGEKPDPNVGLAGVNSSPPVSTPHERAGLATCIVGHVAPLTVDSMTILTRCPASHHLRTATSTFESNLTIFAALVVS